ncbi:ubiquitin carboxyl-terminal hydrolase MINDY-3 homolog [Anabrus simplex]|uniref:ubiquitin carboxyl-terminal hydrolase MINDY-3 homolog n=1 Tax=Anabrus simplex TaxID=316456 RepID=UPI0035A2E98A
MAYPSTSSELSDIQKLLWGNFVKDDVFRRWAQGFHFSKEEPTALEQTEGGPCAVLAPVQAFILKFLVCEPVGNNWREADAEQCNELLVKAVCDILTQASKYNGGRYRLVHLSDSKHSTSSSLVHTVTTSERSSTEYIENTVNQQRVDTEYFHAHLRLVPLETREDVEAFYHQRIEMLHDTFGVLLFLYSVMCTKGSEAIRNEMNDPSEPFIDGTYGYGSQSLINLMITGRAVGHVWDHEQDVGGLRLRGIDRQSDIGFLALLEHLRYCEVGSFLKNPKNPVWVLGSETHLTVLFSFEKQLVRPETPCETARRIFKSFDPEGNNFIPTSRMQDVLKALDLVWEPEYVDIMSKKLDPENLGIVLLNAFMDEFFPDEKSSLPDSFGLFHYNGLPRSCPDGKVTYQEGQAVLLECDLQCVMESNPMLTCLQTKWPNIEVQWIRGITPSLN